MAIYIGALSMHVSTGILMSGWDFVSPHLCWVAITMCLSFYIANKILVYTFLVERVHQLRELRRYKDPVWLIAALLIIGGFGTIAVFAFINPIDEISNIDGKCLIGLHSRSTLLLLGYDVVINLTLTALFLAQSYEWMRNLPMKGKLRVLGYFIPNAFNRMPPTNSLQAYKAAVLDVMISKSLVGAMVIILPTIANFVILYKSNGHEKGWICFTACTLDGL